MKQDAINNLHLTEPFATFKKNTVNLLALVMTSTSNLKRSKEEIDNLVKQARSTGNNTINELLQLSKQCQESSRWFVNKDNAVVKPEELSTEHRKIYEDVNELHKNILRDIEDIKKRDNEIDALYNEVLQDLSTREAILMPMAFVYLVTIWDAFVMDTARNILKIHPQLISESIGNIQLRKIDLWNIGEDQDIREYLIELEVRKLDEDREKLLETFKNYWGIDLNQSQVNLSDITEIRARRDIWVHNSGVVNEQYKRMVGDITSVKKGRTAEITDKYFEESLTKLTILAEYIQTEAHSKHYSKSNNS